MKKNYKQAAKITTGLLLVPIYFWNATCRHEKQKDEPSVATMML